MAEQNRSKKLKRLVTVQRHLEKMAESDLAATTRHREEVAQSMEVVIEAIGSMDPVHRQFSHNYAERYGRLRIKDQQLENVQQFQENKVLKERTKGDRLDEHMKDARDLEDREASDQAIYDLLEITLAAPASSKLQKP
ncbi:MAG: hypothetical protein KJ947_22870 [Alphaproteobacteria bacterium]|jgi:hypothetical protein|uniref:Uncharacterized protein n=1 Tax=Pseudorhizobium pelagicum TaxID=1509405 RepID=A0A922TCE1_9HYPH|nr:hypothetical protein [Pseudorhizobium pelagicum]MBU1314039.1 hypothetical protein [Alphaproteobacteria bacterium]MDY6960367.1 hypothetical protein [Pseudomonadota bacterium]KEQ09408.1 hypothetical protein GV67_01705 [Pseudorhizobium pelagicum]KEQ10772.1 hypothetical protein GV68_00340 [Pseudorhizobium pelagicum]MBU1552391.1 hypothetical protein [Alphaproteobacteria bacterium]|tara:strand:+ start:1417 stop:1830 length:414 start_codon:yes stop_codon:yes gene_type:complete